MCDGIYGMLPEEQMAPEAKLRRRIYEITPNANFIQTEFGYYSLEKWEADGKIPPGLQQWAPYGEWMQEHFHMQPEGSIFLYGAGGCEADFCPAFESVVLEDRGDKQVIRDSAGRSVLVFKDAPASFMPEYVDHPVKDMETWEKLCVWRLDPNTPERYAAMDRRLAEAIPLAKKGWMMSQNVAGGYMYLRSLMGPEDLMYLLYDDPELIHACMEKWFEIADAATAYNQKFVTLDEIRFQEDITYNKGPLISPDMIREFLFPYYTRLFENVRKRQLDPNRKLYINLDSDGFSESVISLYQSIGFNVFSPFEVASGSDVVEIGRKYPDIVIHGGIDKRLFAGSREELDAFLDQLLPVMKARGGYIPTCDHGVPEEANFENYVHYRRRVFETNT